jgi:hypothetical protein
LGQGPNEANAFCYRAGNEVVVPTLRHSVYRCVFSVHVLKVPFLLSGINRIIAPNMKAHREQDLSVILWSRLALWGAVSHPLE